MYDNIGGEMKILSDCTAKNAACIFRYAEKRMARTAELAHIVCRKILSGSNADIMDVICTSDEAREEYISGKKALECDADGIGKRKRSGKSEANAFVVRRSVFLQRDIAFRRKNICCG